MVLLNDDMSEHKEKPTNASHSINDINDINGGTNGTALEMVSANSFKLRSDSFEDNFVDDPFYAVQSIKPDVFGSNREISAPNE